MTTFLVQLSLTVIVGIAWASSGSQFSAFACGLCLAMTFDAAIDLVLKRR